MVNKRNLVVVIAAVLNIAFLVILGILSYRVFQSFDIEGLEDPRAFPAIKDIQQIYDILIPFAAAWSVVLAVMIFIFSKRSLAYKIAMPLLLVVVAAGLYLNIYGFNQTVKNTLATEKTFAELYALVPSEEPTIDYDNTDPAILELLDSSGKASGLQEKIIGDYFSIIEDSIFSSLEVSVILTLTYFSVTAGMSALLVKETWNKKKSA